MISKTKPQYSPAKANEKLFERMTTDELESLDILLEQGALSWENDIKDPWYKDKPLELRLAKNISDTGRRLRRQVVRALNRKVFG